MKREEMDMKGCNLFYVNICLKGCFFIESGGEKR